MNKEIIMIKIAVHPVQARIIEQLKLKEIDLEGDTLREIAQKIKWKESPQIIKHHLEQLVKLGAIQKIYGRYVYQELKLSKKGWAKP